MSYLISLKGRGLMTHRPTTRGYLIHVHRAHCATAQHKSNAYFLTIYLLGHIKTPLLGFWFRYLNASATFLFTLKNAKVLKVNFEYSTNITCSSEVKPYNPLLILRVRFVLTYSCLVEKNT